MGLIGGVWFARGSRIRAGAETPRGEKPYAPLRQGFHHGFHGFHGWGIDPGGEGGIGEIRESVVAFWWRLAALGSFAAVISYFFHLHLASLTFIGTAPDAEFLTGDNGMAGWMGMGHREPKGPNRTGEASLGEDWPTAPAAVRSYAHGT